MSGVPTLSQVRAATWDHLRTNAAAWRSLGRIWEAAFTEVNQVAANPGGTEWTGPAAQKFQGRACTDMVAIRGPADIAETTAQIAERGADTQDANRQGILDAVGEAQRAQFTVAENYRVADTITWYSSAAEQEQREVEAQQHESFIKSRVYKLVGDEDDIARQLTTATATARLHEFSFGDEGEDAGAGADGLPQPQRATLVDDVKRDPAITGPGTTPQLEQDKYDLGATIPNHPEVLLYGDPETGQNALKFPGAGRPIPSGTAVGPDGKQYGFFSQAHGDTYTSRQSTVVDLANPSQSIGVLKDTSGTNIGQASGVYDPSTDTMWVVGNVNGTGDRGMWQSAPIGKGDPNAWTSTLQSRGTFAPDSPMNANRENQIAALPQGGFLLTGAADREGVYGATAATPNGLLTAPTQPLVGRIPSPDPGQEPGWAYGPSIIATQVLPNGQEQVTMRVSTWDQPPGFKPTPEVPIPQYTPRTYTTTVTVNP